MKHIVCFASVAIVFGQSPPFQKYVGKYSGSKQYMDKYTDSGSDNSNTTGFGNYDKYVQQHAKKYEKYMSSADQSSGGDKASGNIPSFSKKYLDKNAKGFEKYMEVKQGDKSFMTKYAGNSQGGGEGSTDDYSHYYKQYMKGGGGASGGSSGDYKQYMQGGGAASGGSSGDYAEKYMKEGSQEEAKRKAKSKAKEAAKSADSQPSGNADTVHKMSKVANAQEARLQERVQDATKTSATQERLVMTSQATATNGANSAFPMEGFFAAVFMTGLSLTAFAFVRRQQTASEPDSSMTGYLLLA
jgi:hypothetical protein